MIPNSRSQSARGFPDDTSGRVKGSMALGIAVPNARPAGDGKVMSVLFLADAGITRWPPEAFSEYDVCCACLPATNSSSTRS